MLQNTISMNSMQYEIIYIYSYWLETTVSCGWIDY